MATPGIHSGRATAQPRYGSPPVPPRCALVRATTQAVGRRRPSSPALRDPSPPRLRAARALVRLAVRALPSARLSPGVCGAPASPLGPAGPLPRCGSTRLRPPAASRGPPAAAAATLFGAAAWGRRIVSCAPARLVRGRRWPPPLRDHSAAAVPRTRQRKMLCQFTALRPRCPVPRRLRRPRSPGTTVTAVTADLAAHRARRSRSARAIARADAGLTPREISSSSAKPSARRRAAATTAPAPRGPGRARARPAPAPTHATPGDCLAPTLLTGKLAVAAMAIEHSEW